VKSPGRLLILGAAAFALACDCGSLDSARNEFCQQRPDVCGVDAGRDAGLSCSAPTVTEPTENESVGVVINLKATGPTCLQSLTAYLDNLAPDAGSPPAMLTNDGGPATVRAHTYPVPYWVPVSCAPHTIVVLGFDSSGNAYLSAPVSFTRTYNQLPSQPCP
jgi:hypothetical protein